MTELSWQAPSEDNGASKLHLYNSMTRRKDLFVPRDGKRVRWYSCGPTVYDASHMGHARSYMTFDILRRVLEGYFHYDVEYVMNITDLDDKIILKARKNYLYRQYIDANHPSSKIEVDLNNASATLGEKIAGMTDEEKDKRDMLTKNKEKLDDSLKQLKDKPTDEAALKEALELGQDALSNVLDKEHGKEVTDHDIFTKLSQYWENEYHSDMKALNVRPPDVLTRVTEYVPEIVTYVEKIIANGFAYESNGSVYFDAGKFDESQEHTYAKLVPEAKGNAAALAEGEGELSSTSDKKNASDFALWKASKAGEPAWPSPWGQGRPGWHIECSVMASDILGDNLDIHTGGVDLKFPHHDNEIAQAEAHYGCKQWVSYFLHSGHLKIEGLKMSKSLKNFITIKEALEKYSGRQLRFMFLLHQWNSTLDYSQNTMQVALVVEKQFNEFFLNVKAVLQSKVEDIFAKWQEKEKKLNHKFFQAKESVHDAMCDNVDTVTAMNALRAMVNEVNSYLKEAEKDNSASHSLLQQIAAFVTHMLRIFGIIEGGQEIGFPVTSAQAALENAILPELQNFAQMRDQIRKLALDLKDKALLAACDDVRDNALPKLGVRLEDKEQGSVVKLVDPDELMKEKERELEERAAKQRKKEEAAKERARKEAEKLEKGKVPPSEMFKSQKEYTAFDADGVPTQKNGEDLTKNETKKLKKLFGAQKKLHQKYLDWKAKSDASQ